ncbi:putative methyltransferase-domain-containing protein [Lentinula guzmanii]|uniref:Methyltransferase-domain-containing protein n=1 Tax=Lentinula guzmanii TaxID=2804957 RepID=A0AA38JG75_9AGAR|nr:putative methyltransferase-domain-containing protein [Lentinula guzmanii]
MANSNFPKNLDIHPSTFSFTKDPPNGLYSLYGHESQKQAIEQYGIAGRVWEAAYILNIYLDPPINLDFDPPFLHEARRCGSIRIIELGSGSGMIGINIASSLKPHLGDLLLLTDLPEVCPLIKSNVEEASKDHSLSDLIHVRPLAWGNTEHVDRIKSDLSHGQKPYIFAPFTHILCSDLIYFPELLGPLLRTIIELSLHPIAGPRIQVLVSYKIRSLPKESPFWGAFGLWFMYEPVLVREKLPDGSLSSWQRYGSAFEGPMFIFAARRRPESLEWIIPSDDRDLLSGFGAHGTMCPKSDDTFETLLLMSLDDTE